MPPSFLIFPAAGNSAFARNRSRKLECIDQGSKHSYKHPANRQKNKHKGKFLCTEQMGKVITIQTKPRFRRFEIVHPSPHPLWVEKKHIWVLPPTFPLLICVILQFRPRHVDSVQLRANVLSLGLDREWLETSDLGEFDNIWSALFDQLYPVQNYICC